MRIRHFILPSLLVVAACAKTSSKLHTDHNLKAPNVKADEVTMTKLVGDGKCLVLNNLINALRGMSQVSMTAYVRNLELRDEGSSEAKPLKVDVATSAKQLLQPLDPPVLIENFTGNTIDQSQLLKPYIKDLIQDADCTHAGTASDPLEYVAQGAVAGKDVAQSLRGAKTVATPVIVHQHSVTRDRLDLIKTGRLLSYHETGSTLVITVDDTLSQTLKTCDDPSATVSRHTEIVLDHSGNFESANLSRSFAKLLGAAINNKSLPKKIVEASKPSAPTTAATTVNVRAENPVQNGNYIILSESEMGTLQTAILAGLNPLPECTPKVNGQPK